MCCFHRWMHNVDKQSECEHAPHPCALFKQHQWKEQHLCRQYQSLSQQIPQDPGSPAWSSTCTGGKALISRSYHWTDVAAASVNTVCTSLSPSLSPRSHTAVVERPGDFTPYLKLLPCDTCKGCWDYDRARLPVLCLLSVRRTRWLNYREWWTEAAEVSCFTAQACNENFTSKDGAKSKWTDGLLWNIPLYYSG